MDKPYFIMLVGIPGSGKSAWAREIKSVNTQVVCPDDIRKKIGESVSDQSVNVAAWVQAEKETITLLEKYGTNVILDATNVNVNEWQDFVSKLPECRKVAKLFEVDPDIAYGRIAMDIMHSKDRCHVPEHAVYRYYGMYLYTKKVLLGECDDFDVTVLSEPVDWIADLRISKEKFNGEE